MKKAILHNLVTGARIPVTSTTEHPDSHYGIPVWVDAENIAYMEDGSRIPNPFYKIEDVRYEHCNHIKEVIKQSGLTQAEIAARMGITPGTLSGIINGNPTIDSLRKLADVLCVSVGDLID